MSVWVREIDLAELLKGRAEEEILEVFGAVIESILAGSFPCFEDAIDRDELASLVNPERCERGLKRPTGCGGGRELVGVRLSVFVATVGTACRDENEEKIKVG